DDDEDGLSEEYDSWISNFCSLFGHDYFVEISTEFIEDDFNLSGLSSMVSYYRESLNLILDIGPESEINIPAMPLIEHSAEVLYGLIHARFILTKPGLTLMAEKYENRNFGSCSRVNCEGMYLLPVGLYDQPGLDTVRLFCPSCSDIYFPSSSRYLNIDGACFGTTFPGLFIKLYPEIQRQCNLRSKDSFSLKIFGFKINELSVSGPRMKWLRQKPKSKEEIEEFNRCEYLIPYDGNSGSSSSNPNNSNNNSDNSDEEEEEE
ncbi:casein kinase 2 regulatory subunit CKB1, partial [Ascoidea rubescens DSM 1968]